MTGSLEQAKRIVVKIGSALIVEQHTLEIRRAWLESLATDVARLAVRGQEVIIVTSGAVAAGRAALGFAKKPLRLEEKQAAAALGQIRLTQLYQEVLGRHDLKVAQILLTLGDTEDRRRHLNARATIETLLARGVVPIINENDTVATSEIRFGDNDRLAARVAGMISADTLILLSDIDGLYTADPKSDPEAVHIPEVTDLTPAIMAMAGPPVSGLSSGGMVTKLQAARLALGAGCRMVIARGEPLHPIAAIEGGARCTWFHPSTEPLTARKRWIAGAVSPAGAVVIDAGAAAALRRGRSLLPAGVVAVEGGFERGDAILVQDREGRVLARGLAAYGSADIARISGHKSSEIEPLLGYRGREEIIHRDDLVID